MNIKLRLAATSIEPTLYIFSGLPGSGKTTLAKLLSQWVGAAYVRIDTIEQGLRDLCSLHVESEGYRLAYRIAQDNLSLGISVVADSCNPITLTRREWESVAQDSKAKFINIEIYCSDTSEHRQRIEKRSSDIKNLKLPSWNDVVQRHYESWPGNTCIRIDTASQSINESFLELCNAIVKTGVQSI